MSAGEFDLLLDQTPAAVPSGESGPAGEIAARSPRELFRRRLLQDKVALAALVFIVGLVLMAIFAPVIVDLVGARPPNAQDPAYFADTASPGLASPHWTSFPILGTDNLGRDIFSRTLYGTRVSLSVALIATLLILLFGVTLGLIAGYYRGWADTVVARAADVILAFPVLLLALGLASACSFGDGCIQMSFGRIGQVLLAVGAVFACGSVLLALLRRPRGTPRPNRRALVGRVLPWLLLLVPGLVLAVGFSDHHGALITPGLPVVIFVIFFAQWPYLARIVRGQTLSLREKEFVEAARSLGASDRRIIFRHILPNLVAPIIVYTTLIIPQVVLYEAALSFLGVGVQAPTASWGAMISEATDSFQDTWWFMTFPGLALLATVLVFNLVGDGLHDALNPRRGR